MTVMHACLEGTKRRSSRKNKSYVIKEHFSRAKLSNKKWNELSWYTDKFRGAGITVSLAKLAMQGEGENEWGIPIFILETLPMG